MTTIRCLDPAGDDLGPALTALYPGVLAAAPQDQPYEPPPTLRRWCAKAQAPTLGDPVRLLVTDEGQPVGCALVGLPAHDNPHVGLVELHVDPAHRRRGLGRALWAAALDLLRAEGRRTVIVEARDASPLAAFLAAVGAGPELVDVHRLQHLARLDLERVRALHREAERAAAGYRLEAWGGPTPEHLRGPLAAANGALNDAPLGGLDYGDEVWDADRVARRDQALLTAGLRAHTVLALAPDGAPAGFTDVMVSEDGTYAWQWGTAVAPAHRGHRLGMLMKTTMLEGLLAAEPGLTVISTWNADSNAHMVAVNEALGYEPVDRVTEWQLSLPR